MISLMWNLKKKTNELILQNRKTHRHRKQNFMATKEDKDQGEG